jgi:Secretion system C-terminal sorting domain
VANDVTVTIFPNPAGSFIHVQCDHWQGSAIITIYSLLGQALLQKSSQAESNSLNETLDVSRLAAGTYMVVVANSIEIGQSKFIK